MNEPMIWPQHEPLKATVRAMLARPGRSKPGVFPVEELLPLREITIAEFSKELGDYRIHVYAPGGKRGFACGGGDGTVMSVVKFVRAMYIKRDKCCHTCYELMKSRKKMARALRAYRNEQRAAA